MLGKIKAEFNKDFTLTKKWDKVCMIYGGLTLPVVLMYIWLKLISVGTSGLYNTLKSFGFFSI